MPPSRLCLASTSTHRATLLQRLGLPFSVADPDIAETPQPGEAPAERATRLALAKATAVAARDPGLLVIGGDQVAVRDGELLHKPGDARRCAQQLLACSGATVRFLTAVALVRGQPPYQSVHLDETMVRFRQLEVDAVARYVQRERPFDCAGGFRAEGLGICLFERIDSSDPTALIGLPMIWLAAALRAAGADPLATG